MCLFCQKGIDKKAKNIIGFADLRFLSRYGIERTGGSGTRGSGTIGFLVFGPKFFVNIGKGRGAETSKLVSVTEFQSLVETPS